MKKEDSTLGTLLEAVPDATVIVDDRGRITLVNAQAERMFGYHRDDMIGQPVELLVPQRFRASHVRDRGKFMAAPGTRPMGVGLDLYGRRKDGSEFPVEISLSPVEVEGTTLAVSAIRDITDRKQAEAERARLIQEQVEHAQASRVKDEFIATLSHELRTPLNAILGWTTLLSQGALDAQTAQQALATIARNAKAQAQLIEDLLDVSRLMAAKLTLHPQPIDFGDVVENAVAVIQPAAESKVLSIERVFEIRPLLMIGDPDRLQQAVWNLLSNAVKFSSRGGRIEVRAWAGEEGIYCTVRDSGRGIAPGFLPYVFDRFRQADSSYTREHGGLGLGLSIVRAIVELHGGTVCVSSSGEGHGAVFRIVLPTRPTSVDAPRARNADATGLEPVDLNGIRVLVVDDQEDERYLAATILRQRGAEVLTAADVDAAISAVEVWRPNVLISDIAMPGQDGYTLLRRVRSLSGVAAAVPAIALTAHARVEDRERALAAGFHMYLPKPIEPVRLVRAVAQQLRH